MVVQLYQPGDYGHVEGAAVTGFYVLIQETQLTRLVMRADEVVEGWRQEHIPTVQQLSRLTALQHLDAPVMKPLTRSDCYELKQMQHLTVLNLPAPGKVNT
jgi:hypothetical protein